MDLEEGVWREGEGWEGADYVGICVGTNVGVAVLGVAVLGVAVLGVAVLGVAVLGVAVLGAAVLGVGVVGAGVQSAGAVHVHCTAEAPHVG
jgi:hypothetical protein